MSGKDRMYTRTTHDILISVKPTYIHAESFPHKSQFVYKYHIQIENFSTIDIQLLSRKWIIKNGFLDTRIVEGKGVVGVQPIIKSGTLFSYNSWCPLDTPIGSMSGTFICQSMSECFMLELAVPQFILVADFMLQ